MRRFIILALLAISTSAFAEDFKYLTLSASSAVKSIELQTIQKITFENGTVAVTTSESNVSLPLAEMQKMFFSSSATGIGEIETMRDVENEIMKGEIYDLSGRRVSNPQKGVYIIKGRKVVIK